MYNRQNGGGPGRSAQARGQGAQNNSAEGGANNEGGQRRKNVWTSVATLRDPWHSDCEIKIRAGFYDAGISATLSPVLAGKQGQVGRSEGPMYDHEQGVMFMLNLVDAIKVRTQLQAFLEGSLSKFEIRRDQNDPPHKVIAFLPASDFYNDETDPDGIHRDGKVICIEEWDKGFSEGQNPSKSIIFIDRPVELQVSDAADGTILVYAELQALLVAIESYLTNCARVDFASVRLIDGQGGQQRQAMGPAAPQPTRSRGMASPGGVSGPAESTGAGDGAPPPVTRTTGAAPRVGGVGNAPRGMGGGQQGAPVADSDLRDAFGARPGAAGKAAG